jgi:hypothetical protein
MDKVSKTDLKEGIHWIHLPRDVPVEGSFVHSGHSRYKSHLRNRPQWTTDVLPVRYEHYLHIKEYSCVCKRLWRPIRLRDVEDPTLYRQLAHKWR